MSFGGFVHDLDMFDSSSSNLSPVEAASMNLHQHLLLEYAYLAFHDTGLTKDDIKGTNEGVYVGMMVNDAAEIMSLPGKYKSFFAANWCSNSTAVGRISYVFGIHGPYVAYDTACSSSLVDLHGAMRALQYGDCDMILVMKINVMLTVCSGLC